MKTSKEFKSDNQLTIELLNRNNVKEIKDNLSDIFETSSKYNNLSNISGIGTTLLELVKKESNDFTKDISEKCLKNEWNLSEKQSWCISFQIHNNIEVYKLSMVEYNNECLKIS